MDTVKKIKKLNLSKGLKEPPSALKEPEARYILRESIMTVSSARGGRKEAKEMIHPIEGRPILSAKGRNESKMTALEKMNLIDGGISKKALESFKEKAQLDYNQLAEFLNVARATLINKKGEDKFNRDVSDKIVSLVDVYSYGYEVFEERTKFNQWIFRPNKALGNQPPFNFLHNSFGRQEIKNLIGRIDYGIYS